MNFALGICRDDLHMDLYSQERVWADVYTVVLTLLIQSAVTMHSRGMSIAHRVFFLIIKSWLKLKTVFVNIERMQVVN